MDIIIRTIKIEDLEKINTLYKEVDDLHLKKYPELFKETDIYGRELEYIKEVMENSEKQIFVAEKDEKILGLAEIFVARNQPFPIKKDIVWVKLENIVVSKDYKKMGIGSMLMECIIDWAKEMNINRIELKVYEKNSEALKFYLNKGFQTLNRMMFLNID